jgi:hypothetical protein
MKTQTIPPRTLVHQRFRSLLTAIVGDLGGPAQLWTGEMQLARRAAWLCMQCELMEQKPVPEMAELSIYATVTSHLARVLNLIGLKRVPKDVTPTLQSYLEARQTEAREDRTLEDEGLEQER